MSDAHATPAFSSGPTPRAEVPVPGQDGFLSCPSGRVLYCVTHAAPAGPLRGVVVFVQPFTEERKASHRTNLRLAAELAQAGFTTHRLDMPGCGESTGQLAALRLADWCADVAHAAGALWATAPAGTPRWIGGLRMGATVAGVCALPGDEAAAAQWLAVAPIVQGAGFLRNLRTRRSIRTTLTADAATQPAAAAGAVGERFDGEEFDGFCLNSQMLGDLDLLDLCRDLKRTSGVVIQAGPATAVTREFTPLENLPGRTVRVRAVRQEPVWDRGEAANDRPLIDTVVEAMRESEGKMKDGK